MIKQKHSADMQILDVSGGMLVLSFTQMLIWLIPPVRASYFTELLGLTHVCPYHQQCCCDNTTGSSLFLHEVCLG